MWCKDITVRNSLNYSPMYLYIQNFVYVSILSLTQRQTRLFAHILLLTNFKLLLEFRISCCLNYVLHIFMLS